MCYVEVMDFDISIMVVIVCYWHLENAMFNLQQGGLTIEGHATHNRARDQPHNSHKITGQADNVGCHGGLRENNPQNRPTENRTWGHGMDGGPLTPPEIPLKSEDPLWSMRYSMSV